MPAPILSPIVAGAPKLVPPIVTGAMQNPMVTGGLGVLAGAAANPVMDTMGRAINYGAGAPMTMEEAKKRGLAGVAGGFADNLTGGMTDFDKRGDSKKQKDVKKFLNQFIYGSDGMN